jgi:heat shock protein HslJ
MNTIDLGQLPDRISSARCLLVAALTVIFPACASSADVATTPASSPTLEGTASAGRLSLATVAGNVWVLRAWDIAEPAQTEPLVTVAYDAGRLSGTSGCNRYFAPAKDGSSPGALWVGPMGGTRMACPEPQSSVESRFLEQLGRAQTFAFQRGRLAISYARADGSSGTMLFDARTP